MVREVLRYPDARLKRPAVALADPAQTARLAADLIDTMASFPRCVGLAAPQIGAGVRVCVIDCTGHPKVPEPSGLLVLVNPVIVAAEGDERGREGCLSIPDLTANIHRATMVRIEATDATGGALALESRGFEARAIQHEIDHLDGILFLDRVRSAADVFTRKRYA